MAAVGTSSKAIFLSWLVVALLAVAVTLWAAQPYLCDRKIDARRPTVCHQRQIVPPAKHGTP